MFLWKSTEKKLLLWFDFSAYVEYPTEDQQLFENVRYYFKICWKSKFSEKFNFENVYYYNDITLKISRFSGIKIYEKFYFSNVWYHFKIFWKSKISEKFNFNQFRSEKFYFRLVQFNLISFHFISFQIDWFNLLQKYFSSSGVTRHHEIRFHEEPYITGIVQLINGASERYFIQISTTTTGGCLGKRVDHSS
jgi:hypothetical protein